MWFLDTGYRIALVSPRDTFHAKAFLQLQGLAQREQRVLATTDAVLFEVGAAFAKTGFRAVGIALIDTLLSDAEVRIHTITPELRSRAIELFAQRPDKEWSLCDCLSFRHHPGLQAQNRGMLGVGEKALFHGQAQTHRLAGHQ